MSAARRSLSAFLGQWRSRRVPGMRASLTFGAGRTNGRTADLVPDDPAGFRRLLGRSLRSDVRGQFGDASQRTDAVMARLGFARVDAATARHRRARRISSRVGTWAMVLSLAVVGVLINNAMPGRLVPADVTVPDAVRSGLERSGEQWGGFLRAIGNLRRPSANETRAVPVSYPVHHREPSGDEAAAAPFRAV